LARRQWSPRLRLAECRAGAVADRQWAHVLHPPTPELPLRLARRTARIEPFRVMELVKRARAWNAAAAPSST
jgi:hypothetical protein